MFTYSNETNVFWFNENSIDNDSEFKLIGTLLGIAIYNSVILDIHYPMIVYKKLVGLTPDFDDLLDFDPILANSLLKLLNYDGNFDELELYFQVEIDLFGKKEVVDLIEDGGKVKVTAENIQNYIDLYVKYKLTDSISKQFNAFKNGFEKVCGGDVLKLFRFEELGSKIIFNS
jgi:hypothetical protein